MKWKETTEFPFQDLSILCIFSWLFIYITTFFPAVLICIPTTNSVWEFPFLLSLKKCKIYFLNVYKIFASRKKWHLVFGFVCVFLSLFSSITTGNEYFSSLCRLTFYLSCVFRYILIFLRMFISFLLISESSLYSKNY